MDNQTNCNSYRGFVLEVINIHDYCNNVKYFDFVHIIKLLRFS